MRYSSISAEFFSSINDLKFMIDDLISEKLRKSTSPEILSAALRTKSEDECVHRLMKEMKNPVLTRQIKVAKFAMQFFAGRPALQGQFSISLIEFEWREKIAKLLNVEPSRIDFAEKKEIALRLMITKAVSNQVILDFIDTFPDLSRSDTMWRFVNWQMTGEDHPEDQKSGQVAIYSNRQSFFSLENSISLHWKAIEPRLIWAMGFFSQGYHIFKSRKIRF